MILIKIIKKCILFTFGLPFLVRRNYINIRHKEIDIDHKISPELQEIKEELDKIKKALYYSNINVDKFRKVDKTEEQEILNILKMFIPYDVEGVHLVRVGRELDGGYLTPKEAILDSEFCVTGGICDDTSFEEDLLKIKDLMIYSFDPTVQDLPLENKSLQSRFMHTQAALIGNNTQQNNIFTLSLTLQDVFKIHNLQNKKGCLKIDIEGSEYDVFEHITFDILKQFTCIIVEFHELSDYYKLKRAGSILELILKYFTLVHIHGNNNSGYGHLLQHKGIYYGDVMECTFIKGLAWISQKVLNPASLTQLYNVSYICASGL